MLPSPGSVLRALVQDAPALLRHTMVTLSEAFTGLFFSILLALVLSIWMDERPAVYQTLNPLLVITQTVPTIAIAPLLVLWLGYEALPKVVLVFITCFFPLTVSILGGLRSVDDDTVRLLRSMGAKKRQILCWVKLPYAVEGFFSGLKVSASYAIVGAVIAEWLGGNAGLGVYMTRVRKAYAFDKMFAVIFLISGLSLVLLWLVDRIYQKTTRWKQPDKRSKQ